MQKTATILSGASLSDAVDLASAHMVGILVPAAWTAANLTFQASPDGVTYGNLYLDDGTEVQLTAAAGRFVSVTTAAQVAAFAGKRYLKVRSGTSGAAVNQGADRALLVLGAV